MIADHWKAIGAVLLLGTALLVARMGCVLPHIPVPGAAASKVQVPPGSTIEVGARQVKVTPPATPADPRPTPIVEGWEPESKVTFHPAAGPKPAWVEISHSGLCLSPFAGGVWDTGLGKDGGNGLTWNVGARVWFSRDLGLEAAANLSREYLRVDWRPGGSNLLIAGGTAGPLGSIQVDGFSAAANGVLVDF